MSRDWADRKAGPHAQRVIAALLVAGCASLSLPAVVAAATNKAAATAAAVPARFALCDDYCAVVDADGKLAYPRLFHKVLETSGPDTVFANEDAQHVGDVFGVLAPDGREVMQGLASAPESVRGMPYLKIGQSLYDADGRRVLDQPGKVVGVWHGHPYYRGCPEGYRCEGSAATFTDARGKTVARFADMPGDLEGALVPASKDGTHYGYVDDTLAFRIAPTFLKAAPFSGGLARVRTAAGEGLIDSAGGFVVAPGRFASVAYDDSMLFIVGRTTAHPDCAALLQTDGTPVDLPQGVCPVVVRDTRELGYMPVVGLHGFGVVDAAGEITVQPEYASLKPLGAGYLAFSDVANPKGAVGVITVTGKVVAQPEYLDARAGPGRTVALRTVLGWGLMAADGMWLAEPRFSEPRLLGSRLMSMTVPAQDGEPKRIVLFGAAGRQLPVTSAYDLQPVPEFVPRAQVRGFKVYAQGKAPSQSGTGLVGLDGHVIVPFTHHVREFVDLGSGLWRVRLDDSATGPDPVYAEDGRRVDALSRFRKLTPFHDGVATARTADATPDAVLVNVRGKILTSFATLFPGVRHLQSGPYDLLDQAINRCYVADPTAYPVYPPPRTGADALICGDAALMKDSEQAERVYAAALAASPWPEQLMALRPAYAQALAQCSNAACVRGAMAAFRQSVESAAASLPKPVLAEAPRTKWALPAGQKRAIAEQVVATQAYRDWFAGDGAADSDKTPLQNLRIEPAWLGGQKIVRVSPRADEEAMGPEQNEPMWWFAADGQERWRLIFSGEGTGVATQYRAGEAMPVLVLQFTSQNGIWDRTYSRYDGRRYVTYLGCEAFAVDDPGRPGGGDGQTLMTCANSRGAVPAAGDAPGAGAAQASPGPR